MNDYRRTNYIITNTLSRFEMLNDALSMMFQEKVQKIDSHSKKKPLAEMKILVAEDERINFLVINFLLKEKVGKVDRAINGREAVELVKSNDYDLILMDINMPLMGGIEATRIIKKMYPNLPVIAQTAFTSLDEKDIFLNAGCDDVMYKPIKREHLLEVLLKYATD